MKAPNPVLGDFKSSKTKINLGENAYLRAMNPADVTKQYVDWLNDPEVNKFLMGPRSTPQTLPMVTDYVRAQWESEEAVLLGLFLNDEFRGTSRVHDIDFVRASAFVGIAVLDKSIWGRGWATRMLNGITTELPRTLGIHTFFAGIEVENLASARAFEKSGFARKEGEKFWMKEIQK